MSPEQTHERASALASLVVSGGLLIFALVVLILVVIVWFRIFKKAGFSGWMALLFFIPLVNLIVLFYFAFAEWPIQRELKQLKGMTPPQPQNQIPNQPL